MTYRPVQDTVSSGGSMTDKFKIAIVNPDGSTHSTTEVDRDRGKPKDGRCPTCGTELNANGYCGACNVKGL